MEEKKKGVQRFFKLSAGRHKREAAPGTPAQAGKGRKGRKWVKPLVILGDNRSSRSRCHDL